MTNQAPVSFSICGVSFVFGKAFQNRLIKNAQFIIFQIPETSRYNNTQPRPSTQSTALLWWTDKGKKPF